MLTKKDRQLLIQDMKAVFVTKDDLKKLPDKKYLDARLEKQQKEISLDVGSLLVEGPLKSLAEHDDRLDKLEKHVGVSSKSS